MSRTRTRHRRPSRYTSIKLATPDHQGFQAFSSELGCASLLEGYRTVLRIARRAKETNPDLVSTVVSEIDAERREAARTQTAADPS